MFLQTAWNETENHISKKFTSTGVTLQHLDISKLNSTFLGLSRNKRDRTGPLLLKTSNVELKPSSVTRLNIDGASGCGVTGYRVELRIFAIRTLVQPVL